MTRKMTTCEPIRSFGHTITDPKRWMSVCTPSVFREIEVGDIDAPTEDEEREIRALERLAAEYGVSITTTAYPRG